MGDFGVDVADVATDADLETYVLGKSALQDLIPDEWLSDDGTTKTAKRLMQVVLDDILQALESRRPPIRPADMVSYVELKGPVCLGTIERLYMGKATHDDSPNLKKSAAFGKQYSAAINSMQPRLRQGSTTSSLSIRLERG